MIVKFIWNFVSKPGNIEDRYLYAFSNSGLLIFKLGQILATTNFLVSNKVSTRLNKLLEDASCYDTKIIEEIIRSDLGHRYDDILVDYNNIIGSASISQVYMGLLKTGEKVAIKVKKPNLIDSLNRDISKLDKLFFLISLFSSKVKYIKKQGILKLLENWVLREVDFVQEVNNMIQIKESHSFCDNKRISSKLGTAVFPKVYREYCSNNVIVMDYLEGPTINKYTNDIEMYTSMDPVKTLKTYLSCSMRLLFSNDEYIYAGDPHPSNIILMENGCGGNIDCGLTMRMSKKNADVIRTFLISIYTKDSARLLRLIKRLGGKKVNDKKLRLDILNYLENIDESSLGYWFDEIIKMFIKYRLDIPDYLIEFGRCMIIIEGTIKSVDEDLTVIELIGDELKRAASQEVLNKDYMTEFVRGIVRLQNVFYAIS